MSGIEHEHREQCESRPGGDEFALPFVGLKSLDHHDLAALALDLSECTEILEVRIKDGASGHSSGENGNEMGGSARGSEAVSAAAAALQDGAIRAMQVRYRHADGEFVDTIIKAFSGWRLVRVSCSENSP